MTTDYRTRLKEARDAWVSADPENRQEVNETWKAYQVALSNYQNVRGV